MADETPNRQPLTGTALPRIETEIPGPASEAAVDDLAQSECPAITARRARRHQATGASQDPIVWERALGANIEDVDGNLYVDLTAAFAVAGLGHNPPEVVAAARHQVGELTHAMGDVYPGRIKIEFGKLLSEVAPGELQQSIFGLSGADAVQAALKTAVVHTGKPGVISFWGGYHGLSYGALSATAYRREFREPFLDQLSPHVTHVPFPDPYRPPFSLPHDTAPEQVRDTVLDYIRDTLSHPASGGEGIGAIIVEPIQGRGGEVVPPPGFLAGLREICDEYGLVLIFDEIYTGFGRTGSLFACEREGVIPDIMCVGKAAGGGAPVSAAIGTPEVMGSWGLSTGEAIHTSTFLGNPLGCAMGKAAVETIISGDWPAKVDRRGAELRQRFEQLAARFDAIGDVRGRGLMLGVDLVEDRESRAPDGGLALGLMSWCREHGYLILPSGTHGNVVAITPPFVITDAQLDGFFDVFEAGLERLS
ncbi:MAG: aspartate aminotransferase family protein [Myxococcota bacterium]